MKQNLLTIKEAAEYLRISIPGIYRLTSQKRIPFIKLGQRVLFDLQDLVIWLNSKKIPGGAV